MWRRFVTWASIVGLGTLSIAYIAGTALYLSPPNPLTLQLWPLIQTMQHPVFAQNWHLFAPNPVRTNHVLAVQCRVGGAATSWFDPFTPMLARHHRTRISPMAKMLRVPQNAIYLFLGKTSDEWRPLLCRRDPRHPMCRGGDAASHKQREFGLFMLRRVSSWACDQVAGRGRASDVRVRILVHEPPPWSGRHLPGDQGTTRYIELPWWPPMSPAGS